MCRRSRAEARPDRHVRILETARHEPGDALARVVQLGGRIDHFRECLRIRNVPGREQFLVVIDDPRIEIQRQAHHASVRLDRVVEAALREVAEVEVRRGHRGVVDVGTHVGEPIVLRELALLDVVGQRDHVEARVARIEFDDRLLALLLLGDHFRTDLDAGQILEFLVVLGEQIAARAFHEEHFDLLTLEPFPVEGALRIRSQRADTRQHTECSRAGPRLEQSTTQRVGGFGVRAIGHDILLG